MKNLFDYYEAEATEERCGLILKGDIIKEFPNIHPEPTKGFEIDPQEIMDHLDEMIGTWHTHPQQTSVFSGEDHICFTQWPSLTHYVIGSDGIRVYKITEGAVLDAGYIPRLVS